ncbi:MAG: anti-sigma factor family protein, partial [Terracidiphilus sp.]
MNGSECRVERPRRSGPGLGAKTMNHTEAVEQMTVEQYLLGELDGSAREDFEEHLFNCPECA